VTILVVGDLRFKPAIFFAGDFVVFAGGFGKNRGAERGFLMVILWWIRGELWLVDGRVSRVENPSLSEDLFFVDCSFEM
jgi:hypothetical protein